LDRLFSYAINVRSDICIVGSDDLVQSRRARVMLELKKEKGDSHKSEGDKRQILLGELFFMNNKITLENRQEDER